jgi:hypothetical protein
VYAILGVSAALVDEEEEHRFDIDPYCDDLLLQVISNR